MFKDQVGLGASDGGIRRQMIQDKLADVFGVAGGDMDQEIIRPAEYFYSRGLNADNQRYLKLEPRGP